MPTRVQIIHETAAEPLEERTLCLQWCRYVHEGGGVELGYRFIWRGPDGGLRPARGQARIPSMKTLLGLVHKAAAEGWGDFDAEARPSEQQVARAPASTRPEDLPPELVEDVQERTGLSQEQIRSILAVHFALGSAGRSVDPRSERS